MITAPALNLSASVDDAPAANGDLTLAGAEARAIDAALAATGGNRAKAAQLLGIARSTLHEKLRVRPN